jgi:hypothetical protein
LPRLLALRLIHLLIRRLPRLLIWGLISRLILSLGSSTRDREKAAK